MDQYSDLKVYGRIKQKTSQGNENDDVVLVPTLNSAVSTINTTLSGKLNTTCDNAAIDVTGNNSGRIGKALIVDSSGGITYGDAGKVDDVKIGSTSLVSNKIATIPAATSGSQGVVSVGTNIEVNNGTISVPAAGSTTLGVVGLGYSASGKNYAIAADTNNNLYVYVPWTDTTYSGGTAITITNGTINHDDVAGSGGTAGTSSATSGASLAVPYVTYNAQGHVTASGTHTHTVNSLPASAVSSGTFDSARIPSATTTDKGAVKVIRASSGDSESITVPTQGKMEEYVTAAIDAMPEPMLFKGTVGSSGATITYANTADAAYKNEGWTYKAITAGTVNTNTAVAAGDTIIYNGSAWVVIPSGDEPSGTVTSVTPGSGLTTSSLSPGSSGDPITGSGTISISDNYRSCHETGTITASNNGSSPASFTPLPIITSLTDGSIREVHLYNSSGTEIGADIRISGTGLSTGEFEISAILPASYSDTWTWVATCW